MLSNKTKGYLSYHHFRVGPASDDYQLSISGFSGNTTDLITVSGGDASSYNINGMKFSTRDRDNDKWNNDNCATNPHVGGKSGEWWYNDCSFIYPNNQYNYTYSIYISSRYQSLPFIEIRIRPINCNI